MVRYLNKLGVIDPITMAVLLGLAIGLAAAAVIMGG